MDMSNNDKQISVSREFLEEMLEDEIELYNLSYSNYRVSDKRERLCAEYDKRVKQIKALLELSYDGA